MDAWLLEHLWKILMALTGAITFGLGWCWRIMRRLQSLEQTRDTFRECLPKLKEDVATLKTQQAVDKTILDRMERTLERIEEKLDGRSN